jgi:hypothetical protein
VRWKSPWYVLYLHCMFNAGGVVNGNDRYWWYRRERLVRTGMRRRVRSRSRSRSFRVEGHRMVLWIMTCTTCITRLDHIANCAMQCNAWYVRYDVWLWWWMYN